jgi:ElaB/YqjD/DUF883 family membrane-anchored ribosome-binding protein
MDQVLRMMTGGWARLDAPGCGAAGILRTRHACVKFVERPQRWNRPPGPELQDNPLPWSQLMSTTESLADTTRRPFEPAGQRPASSSDAPPAASLGKTADDLKNQVGDALDRGRSGISESANAARDSLADDMTKLREDMARMTETLSKFASEAGGEAAKTARTVGAAVASQVGSAASSVAGGAADAMNAASEHAKTFASELEGFARRQPLGALAGALVVGVVVGLMSRGRA